MIKQQKILKAWAVTTQGFEIPIGDCGDIKKKGIIIRPWAIFSTKEQGLLVKKTQIKIADKRVKVVPIEIKILK